MASSSGGRMRARSRGWSGPEAGEGEGEDYYYGSYTKPHIHRVMLKDSVRTQAYRDAICQNPHLFQGKTVLDVGCGTGVLSIFAARAGAKQVFGVDNSHIASKAKEIVLDNGMDGVVTIIQGQVEEVELPVETVDIIVSEWMGYCLVFESMLDSVLVARDRWLAPGGLILPDIVRLFICGVEKPPSKQDLSQWDNLYGFRFKSLKALEQEEAVVDYVTPDKVVTDVALVKEFDLRLHTTEDLVLDAEFKLCMSSSKRLAGLTTYFDVEFSQCHLPVTFSTGPFSPITHWRQTSFFLRREYDLARGEVIRGIVKIEKDKICVRNLDIKIGFVVENNPALLEENLYHLS